MTNRLVDGGWISEFKTALKADRTEVRIICPFIRKNALDKILDHQPRGIQVITRFNLNDFAEGVSELAALEKLLALGACVRGVMDLHAKLYLFGSTTAILTSANLTDKALEVNHEYGLVSRDPAIVKLCNAYFNSLWERSKERELTRENIDEWKIKLAPHYASRAQRNGSGELGDFGAKIEATKTKTQIRVRRRGYEGCTVYTTVPSNPRRTPKPGALPNSHVGFHCMERLIAAGAGGMTWDAYTEAGGRLEDWLWDFNRGWSRVVGPNGEELPPPKPTIGRAAKNS